MMNKTKKKYKTPKNNTVTKYTPKYTPKHRIYSKNDYESNDGMLTTV